MIELAKIQTMHVYRKNPDGFLLKSRHDMRQVLLPHEEVIGDIELGDEIKVFIYKNADNKMTATMTTPMITLDSGLKELEVVGTATSGAFMNWGLAKDLFLPNKEQKNKVRVGQKYLVGLYVSNQNRICATQNIHRILVDEAPFKEGDSAYGIVYDVKKDMGAFVAVESKYHGLIPKHEIFKDLSVGDRVDVRVTKVREDGKLNLSMRKMAYQQMDDDSTLIYNEVAKNGFIPFNDKTAPEKIKKTFGLSKKAFKRAVGRLLKEDKIEFKNDGIAIKE